MFPPLDWIIKLHRKGTLMNNERIYLLALIFGIMIMISDKQNNIAQAQNEKQINPAFAEVIDDPALPRVLLIGDSISIGYTVPVRELLKGVANVHRIPENAGPTKNGVEHIGDWLGEGKWDVIHFNFGLHDLKIMDDGNHQVEIEAYATNLRKIIESMHATGAKLIWANTTPVPKGELKPLRKSGDDITYNAAAENVMREFKIPINDLYSFAMSLLDKIQIPSNVHFTAKGYELLGKQVANRIKKEWGKG